jgi:hypothetical protein
MTLRLCLAGLLLLAAESVKADTLQERIPPPPGYQRIEAADRSFGAWLRRLPLLPAGAKVLLYDGREKAFQGGAHAVLDLDVGERDLQQCADAVLRLRAEYLRETGCEDGIAFRFTSGDLARWSAWKAGMRPVVRGNEVTWKRASAPDGSDRSFRRYLDTVFTYAGSSSLSRELTRVQDPTTVQPGDVFIQGGFPGHAVLVADVAVDARGRRAFILAQSYMPAQSVHVLRNLTGGASPWFEAKAAGSLVTPEWTFSYTDLRRFPGADCGGKR